MSLSHLFEVLEGELVHMVDLRQTGDDKVQDRASGSHGSVALPGRVDHQLSSLCLLQTVLDGLRCHLMYMGGKERRYHRNEREEQQAYVRKDR